MTRDDDQSIDFETHRVRAEDRQRRKANAIELLSSIVHLSLQQYFAAPLLTPTQEDPYAFALAILEARFANAPMQERHDVPTITTQRQEVFVPGDYPVVSINRYDFTDNDRHFIYVVGQTKLGGLPISGVPLLLEQVGDTLVPQTAVPSIAGNTLVQPHFLFEIMPILFSGSLHNVTAHEYSFIPNQSIQPRRSTPNSIA